MFRFPLIFAVQSGASGAAIKRVAASAFGHPATAGIHTAECAVQDEQS